VKPEAEVQTRLDQVFDRVERMTDSELVMLRAIWDAQNPDVRENAWAAVKATLRTRKRQGLLDDSRARLTAWINNYPTGTLGEYGYYLVSGSGMAPGAVRQQALPPLLDAIAATIAADGLTAEDETVLLEPLLNIAPHRASS